MLEHSNLPACGVRSVSAECRSEQHTKQTTLPLYSRNTTHNMTTQNHVASEWLACALCSNQHHNMLEVKTRTKQTEVWGCQQHRTPSNQPNHATNNRLKYVQAALEGSARCTHQQQHSQQSEDACRTAKTNNNQQVTTTCNYRLRAMGGVNELGSAQVATARPIGNAMHGTSPLLTQNPNTTTTQQHAWSKKCRVLCRGYHNTTDIHLNCHSRSIHRNKTTQLGLKWP